MFCCQVCLAFVLFLGSCSSFVQQSSIDGEYLIELDPNEIQNKIQEDGLVHQLKFDFGVNVVKAFHAGIATVLYVKATSADISRVKELPQVKYVEPNGYVYIMQTCSEQPSPGTWGLDRIDQANQLSYTDPVNPSATYTWGERLGTQSVAYIADTGIDTAHPDFEGRAIWGYTVPSIIEPETDLNGHGTHVAGIIGSTSYGVAKAVTLVAVKVMSRVGSGLWSDVIDGLDWILQDHINRGISSGSLARSVVNMSLGGGGAVPSLETFIQQMYDDGITVTVSAGGSLADACDYSPARTPNATTVASIDISDSTTNSNYGTCLDIFAPGVNILSTTPENETDVFSGTSMASAYVAGVVARYQDSLTPAPTSQQVSDWLVQTATPDVINMSSEHIDSPNVLLYANC